jgi:TPR repeat protein/serine/threonine protein kinase/parvulin-like peptidyl-prolyl isomerase
MEPHRLALPVGFQIEHFRIEAVLGKGGFGITYLAVDLQLGKRVAIKELLPDTIATRVDGLTVVPHSVGMQENWEWARDRFLEEARTLATFSHPAIVGVHRLIEANGTVYMVMDYVEGESYEARLQRIGTEPDQKSLMAVMGPILSGLEEVHSHGLLHRDIKPENILIDRRGQPVLIDFGSARESVGKTMTMTSIVTHGYSPIEQYQTKGRMGPWTDIYAMAAVMCRAVAGEKPPVASDRVIEEAYGGLVPSGSSGYSRSFCSGIDWALRVKPEERPQSIHQWKEQLIGASDKEAATSEQDSDAKTALKAQCPHCSQRVEMNASLRGALVDCPTCRESFRAGSYDSPTQQSSERVLPRPARKSRWPFVAGAVAAGLLVVSASLMLSKPKSSDAAREKGLGLIKGDGARTEDVIAGIKLLERAAQKGDVEAQLFLGKLFSQNNPGGPSQDFAAAIRWYTMASEQGSAFAQYNLGVIHYSGSPPAEPGALNFRWWTDSALPKGYIGPAQGPEEAVKWWREAAEQGSPEAQMLLGLAYSDGVGIAKDAAQAANWWKKAAEQGLAGAQYLLGLAYSDGRGIDEDKSEALTWYEKAAEQGDASAEMALAYLYQNGGGESFDPDPAKALEWFRKAAQRDDPNAQLEIGNAYTRGNGVTRNFKEAALWYAKAAEQGNAEAQYLLALLMQYGEGVDKNEDEARKLFVQAAEECRKDAERGNADAQLALYTMHANGYGVEVDNEQATEWLVKALQGEGALTALWLNTDVPLFDGIPNVWILEHRLDYTNPNLPEDDPDQDGFSNREEHDAGTDPLDATSKPQTKGAGSPAPAPLTSGRTPASTSPNVPLGPSRQPPDAQKSGTSAAVIRNLPDPIAIVEGEPISLGDLENTYLSALESAGINGEDLSLDQQMAGYREVLDELIVDRLISRKAAFVGISDAELEEEISRIKTKFPGEENFKKEMTKAGETMASFRDNVRKMMQQQKWMERQITGNTRITESDVRQFYEKNKKEFAHPELVRASHILIRVPEGATDEVVSEKKLLAEKALHRVSNRGESFASVAKEVSEEPGASDSGGDLDYFPKDRMVPEFANAAFAMRSGEISTRPVRTKFGWHVIKVTDRKQADTLPFTEVKDQVKEYLEGSKKREAVRSVIDQIRAGADVLNKFPKGP